MQCTAIGATGQRVAYIGIAAETQISIRHPSSMAQSVPADFALTLTMRIAKCFLSSEREHSAPTEVGD